MEKKYDLFCSYSHVDNDSGWVISLIDNLSSMYQKLTGEPLKIFLDKESIITSEIWEKKIKLAIKDSKLFITILSPSYFKSKCCVKEWELISSIEKQLRIKDKLPEEFGLIVPILLHPLDRGKFSNSEKLLISDAKKRQWLDFSLETIENPLRPTKVKSLTENIIDVIYELESTNISVDVSSIGTLIIDTKTNLMWSGVLSPNEMMFESAKLYVKKFELGGLNDWRLPTEEELKSLVEPKLLDPDPNSNPFPLYEPFNIQRYGFLHSGTLVSKPHGNSGNYIMNVRNGHIFNGLGYKAFVRPVRNQ